MSEKDFFLDECQNRWIEIHHNGRMYYVDEYNNACWRLFDLRNKFNEGI